MLPFPPPPHRENPGSATDLLFFVVDAPWKGRNAARMLKRAGYKCLIKYNSTSISVDADTAEVKVTIDECNIVPKPYNDMPRHYSKKTANSRTMA